ncbi:hypothetical protein ABF87_11660 [Nitrosomonas sp. JL21]|uniref:hypothetical protein n=1 Tax=Nitrosomonas sp. JL21 TaxID=153949 RepID=UPI001371D501|nr:hypothetical protein [Nitrosomonas sp. JL21]MBL8496969.1 hypothetical protein [Nitrosomonas sp.]MCC7091838.1 hypothetical protein [Nitrosomonas sp.]MXS78599.1 hypothetical protein [Nitrosomonas sp. JL21]
MRTVLSRSLFNSLLAFIAIIGVVHQNESAFAHTVIQPTEVTEGKSSENYLVITHGCSENPVMGSSVVFPDGLDSTIAVNGNPHTGPLSDFVTNWGNSIQLYQDRSVFSEQDVKRDSKSNVVGFWAGGGRTVAPHLFARIAFVSSSVLFNSESCAQKIRFAVAVADICKITAIDDMSTDNAVSLWVPAVGSKFDGTPGGHAFDFPAFFTITRDLTENPLPESCGGVGQQISVRPSAAQVDRDMPIQFNGAQVWPQP